MRQRAPSRVDKLALLFVGLAALALLVWRSTERADEWLPNLAGEALSIAVTVAIVDRIIRREDQAKTDRRRYSVLGRIDGALLAFGWHVLEDYTATHGVTYDGVPNDFVQMLGHWHEGLQDADLPREGSEPLIHWAGTRLADALDDIRTRDRDVIDHDLLVDLDHCVWEIRQWSIWFDRIKDSGWIEQQPGAPPDPRVVVSEKIVEAVHGLMDNYRPVDALTFDHEMLAYMAATRDLRQQPTRPRTAEHGDDAPARGEPLEH